MQKRACLVFTGTVLGILLSPVNSNASLSSTWRPIFTFTSGKAFNSDAGQSKNFPANATSFSYYNYDAHHVTQSSFIFGALIGAEFALNALWSIQTGLAYYATDAFNAKGTVTQGVDIISQNQYSYQYDIQSDQLLLENKLFYHIQRYHPYALIGIGAARNRSKNFVVNIDPPFTTFSNQFASNTVTAFTYDVGFGVDVDLTDQMRLGIGYRFTDLGSAKTGRATINETLTDNVLSQPHLYAQEALVQITLLY